MDQPEPFLYLPLTGQFNDLLRLCAEFSPVALTGYDGDAFMHEPQPSRLQNQDTDSNGCCSQAGSKTDSLPGVDR